MSRLVRPQQNLILGADAVDSSGASPDGGDDYAARVAKYIPGEVLAAYVSIGGIISGLDPTRPRPLLAWVLFGLCVVLTPVYLAKRAEAKQPKRMHLALSTLAFVVWAYAVGGPFTGEPWHDPAIGSIALGIFTLVSGAFAPKPGDA
jgi:hypothetical protein